MILETIKSGKAYDKFLELVEAQGGDTSYIKDLDKFEKARYIVPVLAEEAGYVSELDAEKVGEIAMELGAGRIKKEDNIDHAAGIVLKKKIGDKVEEGEPLAYIHANDETKGNQGMQDLKNAYRIVNYRVDKPQYVLGVIE